MATLNLQLLGRFRATTGSGSEITIQSKKGRALLAILAVSQSGGMSREKLAALLWSDRGEEQARSSLRQTLTILRKELAVAGQDLIVADDLRVELAGQGLEVDAVKIVELSRASDASSLRQAVELHKGEFLADVSVNDPAFEEWLRHERSRLRDGMTTVFERLLKLGPDVSLAKRLLDLDPLREASNLALMQAFVAAGERAMALQHYAAFKELLKSELNVEPGAKVEQLRLKLKSEATSMDPRHQTESAEVRTHERPSIAVLTFVNLSNDPAQRYFSDGITADIVTELSRFHQLQVHAQKQAAGGDGLVDSAAMKGRELGVQYVVEGSVRRMGGRVRITAQLIDSATDENVWAERFDANEDEIFAVQDQIVRSIAAQLVGHLRMAKLEKALRNPPSNMAAYDYVLRGDAMQIGIPEAEAEAIRYFRQAIELAPGYGLAHAHLATHLTLQWIRDYSASNALLDEALDLAKKAVALDGGDERCQFTLGYVYLQRNSHELAEYYALKALALNPNSQALLASTGILYGFRGESERSLTYFRDALAINPRFIPSWYWRNRAIVHFDSRDYEEAISAFKRSPILPDWVEAHLAAANAQLGRMDAAHNHVAAALRQEPNFRIRFLMAKSPYLRREDADHLANALRKAGFTD